MTNPVALLAIGTGLADRMVPSRWIFRPIQPE